MDAAKIRSDLKSRIAKGLNFGMEAVEEIINPSSPVYNRFILLKSKYNDLMHVSSENTLPYDQIEIGFNRFRSSLIKIIDDLTDEDIGKEEVDTNVKVSALSNRRTNFFNLLDIHFKNLDNFIYREVFYKSGGEEETSEKIGREAIVLMYNSCHFRFGRKFKEEEVPKLESVKTYFLEYFEVYAWVFEVYFKTLKHILKYIEENDIEKLFFSNTIKSQLSRYELVFLFYYTICEIDPEFKPLMKTFNIFAGLPPSNLIHEEHYQYF